MEYEWPEEYKIWKDRVNYMYYVDNNLDYVAERFLEGVIYRPDI